MTTRTAVIAAILEIAAIGIAIVLARGDPLLAFAWLVVASVGIVGGLFAGPRRGLTTNHSVTAES